MLIRKRQINKAKATTNIKRGKFSKKVKKDYHSKCLNNPFFRSKKTKKSESGKNRLIIYIILSTIFLAAVIYLFIFSEVFKASEIVVSGNERIDTQKIIDFVEIEQEKKLLLILPQSSLIFINANKLADEIKSEFSLVDVSVKKKFFHRLEIAVSERPIAFIWQDGELRVYSDEEGCLIREQAVLEEDLSQYLSLFNEAGDKYLKKNDCLDLKPEYFLALLSLNDELAGVDALKVNKYMISSELNSLVLDLLNGPNIIFNSKEDLTKQVKKLLTIKDDKKEEEFLALEYIDLRFGDLIYLK